MAKREAMSAERRFDLRFERCMTTYPSWFCVSCEAPDFIMGGGCYWGSGRPCELFDNPAYPWNRRRLLDQEDAK